MVNDIPCAQARTQLNARAALAALYIVTAFFLSFIWSFVPAESAYAYVDPSVMTYTIQALAGVAVALSAVAGVAFRRTRRKIYQILKIDENANKIVDTPVERIDPTSPDAAQRLADARAQSEKLAEEGRRFTERNAMRDMTWRTRFVFALVMTVFFFFIVFVAPALEIVGSNADSLVFGLSSVWWIPVVFCTAFALVGALLISLLKGRAFYCALLAVFLVTLAAYVQSLFMNQGMMPADGGFIGWTDQFFVDKMIFSGIVWALIIIVPFIFTRKYRHVCLQATTGLACAIIIMQLVGVASVAIEAHEAEATEGGKPYVTQGDLLTVAPKNNVIVFVLDTYDTALLEQIREEDPSFLDDFTNFTYWPDCTGTMIPTTNAIPNLLTGLKPAPGEDLGEYRRTKYEKSTFFKDIAALDYSMGIYSDSMMMDFRNSADLEATKLTNNVHPVNRAPVDIWRTFVAMEQCALYREALWVAKPLFWYYTSDINNRMIADSGSANHDDSLYELDDAAILGMLRNERLAIKDEGRAGTFRFIHLFGPHFPFSVDEEGNNVGTNQSDQIAQAKGSMRVVTEYLDQMRELGVYDDATVIVTADHGVWNLTDDPVHAPISPIMLAKPALPAGAPEQPIEISSMPVSHDDFQATVIAAMGGDSSRYGSTLFEIDNPGRVRYFDALTSAGDNGQHFVEYEINGNVFDLSNWNKTGNEWYGA